MGSQRSDIDEQSTSGSTPEDVAALYAWANMRGAKYRDYSASRREQRAQVRYLAAKALLDRELAAQADAEAAAVEAEREAAAAEARALAGSADESQQSRFDALRVAEAAALKAARDRVEAARRSEAATHATVLALREKRELAEAHESAAQQAMIYNEAEALRRRLAGPQPRMSLGKENARAREAKVPGAEPESEAIAVSPAEVHEADSEKTDLQTGLARSKPGSWTPLSEEILGPGGDWGLGRQGLDLAASDAPPEQAPPAWLAPPPVIASEAAVTDSAVEEGSHPALEEPEEISVLEQAHILEPQVQEEVSMSGQPDDISALEPMSLSESGEANLEPEPEPAAVADPEEPMVQEQAEVQAVEIATPEPDVAEPVAVEPDVVEPVVPEPGVLEPVTEAVGSSSSELQQTETSLAELFVPEVAVPVLAVFSVAAGLGATSLVAAIGSALAAAGERVVLADLTAAAALPFYFGGKALAPGLMRTYWPPEATGEAISVLRFDASGVEGDDVVQQRLMDQVVSSVGEADRLILDVAPAAVWLLRGLVHAEPLVLVPLAPTTDSLAQVEATEKLFYSFAEPLLPYYILNRFDASSPQHQDARTLLRRTLGDRLLEHTIRETSAIGEALAEGCSVLDYVSARGAPAGDVVGEYRDLAAWLKGVSPLRTAANARPPRSTT